jgi:predicted TIM-barrel fold metal-dependent hydrolase
MIASRRLLAAASSSSERRPHEIPCHEPGQGSRPRRNRCSHWRHRHLHRGHRRRARRGGARCKDRATQDIAPVSGARSAALRAERTGAPDTSGSFMFLSDAAQDMWAAADDLGLVIVLMPLGVQMAPAMKRVGELAARYPNVKIVLDHIGFPNPAKIPDTFGLTPEHLALASHKNVYYQYTTLLIEQLLEAKASLKGFLHHMVGVYGADHLVWGSDIGNSEVLLNDFVTHALDSADGLTLDQKKEIFYITAKAVFIPGGRGPKRS